MEVYLGTILAFGFTYAPRGWMMCNGQQLSIAQNSALFSLLGTTYGGNGQTTFALPNFQSRVMIGMGQGQGLDPYQQGEVGGSQTATILVNNMPQHTHLVNATKTAGVAATPAPADIFAHGNYTDPNTGNPVDVMIYGPPDGQVVQLNPATIAPAGGTQPIAIMNPYLAMNMCIAIEGLFPSRN